ncbi:M24 family metallopeptidase [Halobacterium zhouii]|uniref:M24 family metallopeptidase n=1 Tax=Halobacterium zhouii TaxID=2902624 RepID=UPI001E2BB507|nr:Xaa-Pro peptidase family protein [Halobacterium zhouii]
MDPDLSELDDFLADGGFDGYFLHADGDNSNQHYLSGFDAPDPFLTLYTPDTTAMLLSPLEYGRAKEEARADEFRRATDYDVAEKREEYGSKEAIKHVHAEFFREFGVESAATNPDCPLSTADGLRETGIEVSVDRDEVIPQIRAVKTDEELAHVHDAQKANEAAMRAAEDLLRAADAEDGELVYEGDPLTSEAVRQEIETTLLAHSCALDETIVAGGEQAAGPHNRGSGPLPADSPIVVDIFPQNKDSKYHADMTRTFVHGDASDEAQAFYDVTAEAKAAALDAVEPGATGEEVHDAVCDVYEDAGYSTLRSDPEAETGFIHSTGHGVGLDVHELPNIAPRGEELEPGHVITIEPGLYDPDVGGVRIEDLVVVTEDGYENYTDYAEAFEL